MPLPTQLMGPEYFINFERENYNHRTDQARLGIAVPRACPTANLYKQHQIANQKIMASDSYGLYSRIPVADFYGPLEQLVHSPRSWHGEPIHMIRRAFNALGSLHYRHLPSDVYQQL
jgi:hypothetical protein